MTDSTEVKAVAAVLREARDGLSPYAWVYTAEDILEAQALDQGADLLDEFAVTLAAQQAAAGE